MKSLIEKHHHLIKYFFIGVSAAVIDVLIYYFVYNKLQFNATLSTVISVGISTIYGFLMNVRFNFKTQGRVKMRFALYASVSFTGLVASALLLFVFADTLGFNGNIIKILSLPFIFVLQYSLNKIFTFSHGSVSTKVGLASEKELLLATDKKKVAIVGGGFTGMAAAYDLSKAGYDVTILEREKFVGGLASGFTISGNPIEKAYHFLYQSDTHILSLAEELGMRDKIGFYESKISYFYHGKHYPFTTPVDLLRFNPLSFVDRIRAGVTALFLQKTNNWRALSTITAYDWLNKWAGKSVTKVIWEPLLKGKFERYYDKVTMSWLWGRIKIRAKSQNKDMSGEKLGYVKGGFAQFTNLMSDSILKNAGKIKTGVEIKKIDKTTTGENVIEFVDGSTETFDSIIVTTPSSVFARLVASQNISPDYIAKLNSVDYLGAIIMVISSTQKISDYFWYNINDERVPFLTMLSTTALVGTENFNGRNVYYVGAYVPNDHRYFTEDSDSIRNEWMKGIKLMFPFFDESQIETLDIFKFKNAQHIVDIGYETTKLLPFETPIEGVYLSNFSQIYPDDRGTNFAIRDGRRVAKEVSEYLNR